MLKCSSRWTRGSKSSSSIRSDCASVPTRGSRLVGLLSMIITTVFASGRLAQESMLAHRNKQKSFNHKVEKPIFMRLRGPKALDDKGHEGTEKKSSS